MQAQDRQEKERADARNALEEYVYELRGKLSEGEALHDFVAADQRTRLVAALDALEAWLYEEGEEQNRQVFNYLMRYNIHHFGKDELVFPLDKT